MEGGLAVTLVLVIGIVILLSLEGRKVRMEPERVWEIEMKVKIYRSCFIVFALLWCFP